MEFKQLTTLLLSPQPNYLGLLLTRRTLNSPKPLIIRLFYDQYTMKNTQGHLENNVVNFVTFSP